jgi:hypothetical protein
MSRSKYTPDAAMKVKALGKLGYCVTDAAHALGIKHATFANWERRHAEFANAAKRVRANSQRAMNMRYVVMCSKTEAQLLKALAHVRKRRADTLRRHGYPVPKRWAEA